MLYWNNELLVLQESRVPYAMDPASLNTLGKHNFKGILSEEADKFTAHPRLDANTNRLIGFSSKINSMDTITVREFDSKFTQTSSRY